MVQATLRTFGQRSRADESMILRLSRGRASAHSPPWLFRLLHGSTTLTALGDKGHLISFGDALRWLIGETLFRKKTFSLQDFLEGLGQYGVSVSGGVELLAEQTL